MKKLLLLVAVGAAWALVSQLSYEDAVTAEDQYCAMVTAGHWPNYRNLACEGYATGAGRRGTAVNEALAAAQQARGASH